MTLKASGAVPPKNLGAVSVSPMRKAASQGAAIAVYDQGQRGGPRVRDDARPGSLRSLQLATLPFALSLGERCHRCTLGHPARQGCCNLCDVLHWLLHKTPIAVTH